MVDNITKTHWSRAMPAKNPQQHFARHLILLSSDKHRSMAFGAFSFMISFWEDVSILLTRVCLSTALNDSEMYTKEKLLLLLLGTQIEIMYHAVLSHPSSMKFQYYLTNHQNSPLASMNSFPVDGIAWTFVGSSKTRVSYIAVPSNSMTSSWSCEISFINKFGRDSGHCLRVFFLLLAFFLIMGDSFSVRSWFNESIDYKKIYVILTYLRLKALIVKNIVHFKIYLGRCLCHWWNVLWNAFFFIWII